MRRAEIRTDVARADAIAAAIRPDNTAEMATRVEDGTVVTTIERESTSGLRSTADDYVVNLDVARRAVEAVDRHGEGSRAVDAGPEDTRPSNRSPEDTEQ